MFLSPFHVMGAWGFCKSPLCKHRPIFCISQVSTIPHHWTYAKYTLAQQAFAKTPGTHVSCSIYYFMVVPHNCYFRLQSMNPTIPAWCGVGFPAVHSNQIVRAWHVHSLMYLCQNITLTCVVGIPHRSIMPTTGISCVRAQPP